MVNLFDILPGEFFILILRFFPIPPWFISGLVEIGQCLIKYPTSYHNNVPCSGNSGNKGLTHSEIFSFFKLVNTVRVLQRCFWRSRLKKIA